MDVVDDVDDDDDVDDVDDVDVDVDDVDVDVDVDVSSHEASLMLLNSIPSSESSFGTLRMRLEKTIPCGVPSTAISHSSLIPRKILSCHFASTWTFLLDCSK